MAASGSVGVGATVVVLVFDKEVKAIVKEGPESRIYAKGDVDVNAKSTDNLWLLAITFGAAGTVGIAGGANTLLFQNYVEAALGTVKRARNVSVNANTDETLVNVAATVGFGGTVGVAAVAVITYFESETLAHIFDNAKIGSATNPVTGDVTVSAITSETVTADAAGASGGLVGVGGTADIIITDFATRAFTGSDVEIYAVGDVTINAEDKYTLVAAVVTVALGVYAGVGVTALVSVSYNTVEAYIGTNNTVVGKSVSVKANTDRDIVSVSSTIAGGAAGVGVTVAVVVSGNKLSQDAHKVLYSNEYKDNDGKTHDGQGYQEQSDAAFKYKGVGNRKPKMNLTDALEGDGQSVDGTDYKAYGQKDDVKNKKDVQSEDDKTKASENDTKPVNAEEENAQDLTDFNKTEEGKEGSGTSFKADAVPVKDKKGNPIIDANGKTITYKDATSAQIKAGSHITATAGDINVTATDVINANMISGGIAAGAAGVGFGAAVSILYSNVVAMVEDGAVLSATGDIKVIANAGSDTEHVRSDDKVTSRKNSKVDIGSVDNKDDYNLDEKAKPIYSTIRLISVAGAVGGTAANINASVLMVFTTAKARMNGSVISANNINVNTNVNFGTVITVNAQVAGGTLAANVSGAATYFEAKSEAAIDGNANIENVSGNINVHTDGTTDAHVVSIAVAAGGTSINAGVALAINRSTADTFIGKSLRQDLISVRLKMMLMTVRSRQTV